MQDHIVNTDQNEQKCDDSESITMAQRVGILPFYLWISHKRSVRRHAVFGFHQILITRQDSHVTSRNGMINTKENF